MNTAMKINDSAMKYKPQNLEAKFANFVVGK